MRHEATSIGAEKGLGLRAFGDGISCLDYSDVNPQGFGLDVGLRVCFGLGLLSASEVGSRMVTGYRHQSSSWTRVVAGARAPLFIGFLREGGSRGAGT